MSIVSPHQLPSGRRIFVDSGAADDLQHRLTFGDPALGWEGCETLVLILAEGPYEPNDPADAWWWEVWDVDAQGRPYRCIRGPKETRVNDQAIISLLVQRDTRRTDPIADIDRHNESVRRAAEADADALIEEHADRLYSALRRDGAHRH